MLNTSNLNTKPVNGTDAQAPTPVEQNLVVEVTDLVGAFGSSAPTIVELSTDFLSVIDSYTEESGYKYYLEALASSPVRVSYALEALAKASAESPVATFYNPEQELMEEITAREDIKAVSTAVALLSADARDEYSTAISVSEWLLIRAKDDVDKSYYALIEQMLVSKAVDIIQFLNSQTVTDRILAGDYNRFSLGVEVLDQLAAEVLQENILVIGVEEKLTVEASDSMKATGRYRASVKDIAGAWVVFKLSDEVVTGWVMNLEGEQPFSQYENYQFNSFARIGDSYLAATDEGLYVLDGDSDEGEQIDAHVTTMMLDFGTSKQKRVVSAYLGYTSNGKMVLKVRSVDDGLLVENWYEANEKQAEAPVDGYASLGRGMKSRYWQFSLANDAGAEFEVDQLELYPLILSRRV